MSKEGRTSIRSNGETTRSRLIATGFGVLALLGAAGIVSQVEASPVPCDPVMDNGCVPGGPENTLPTLPEKGEDDTTTTTMYVPPTTEYVPPVVTTVPGVTVTTEYVPPVVPPAQPQAPHTS